MGFWLDVYCIDIGHKVRLVHRWGKEEKLEWGEKGDNNEAEQQQDFSRTDVAFLLVLLFKLLLASWNALYRKQGCTSTLLWS